MNTFSPSSQEDIGFLEGLAYPLNLQIAAMCLTHIQTPSDWMWEKPGHPISQDFHGTIPPHNVHTDTLQPEAK